MGLDAVEMVLRAEEFFVINIDDDEASSVRTVGDFYKLICAKLCVTPLESPLTPAELPLVTEKREIVPIYTEAHAIACATGSSSLVFTECLGFSRCHHCRSVEP